MHIYFDNNVLINLVGAGIDPIASLNESGFVIAVTPDLAAEYEQAIGNKNVAANERDLCFRLLSVSREIGVFGFAEAGGGYSGFNHGLLPTESMRQSIASTPITDRPNKPIPKNRTDALLVALAEVAIVVTNDTGGHWNRARDAGHHVYSWKEIVDDARPVFDLASRLRALISAKP